MLYLLSSHAGWGSSKKIISPNAQDQQLLAELALASPNVQVFSLQQGITKLNGRIWLGNHKEAHEAVLLALHNCAWKRF